MPKRIDYEGREQEGIMHWLSRQYPQLFEVTYHVPNGGHRIKSEAARFKRQGVKAGVSDIVISHARGGFFGLYIEFKATPPKNCPATKSQIEWLDKMAKEGYMAVLCKGFDAAKKTITSYMAMPKTVGVLEDA